MNKNIIYLNSKIDELIDTLKQTNNIVDAESIIIEILLLDNKIKEITDIKE